MHILVASTLGAEKLRAAVVQLGHVCDAAGPMSEVPSAAAFSGPYDAIILETVDVQGEVLSVLRDMRNRGLSMPVVVLAGRLRPEDEQEAFDAGADDVLTSPTNVQLMVVRLQVIQRRLLGYRTALIHCGNVVLNQSERTVRVDGHAVRLTAREFDVLEALMLRRGMLLTKEQFQNRAYAESEGPNLRILDVFICKLRRKLAAVGAAEIVRTVWGSGYMLHEPTEAEIASARQRFRAGKFRRQRAQIVPSVEVAA